MGGQTPSRGRIPPPPLRGGTATLLPRFAAPVAQLDRASVYGTEGQRFESSRARSTTPVTQPDGPVPACRRDAVVVGRRAASGLHALPMTAVSSPVKTSRVA